MNSYATVQPLDVFSKYCCGWRQLPNQIFAGMAAALRHDKEFRRTAMTLIRSGDDKAKLLIQALGSACGIESQEALNRLTREAPPGAPFRSMLLRSLSDCAEPTHETLETHLALLQDDEIGEQSHLGLGKLVYTLVRRQKRGRARQALSVLLERLCKASGTEQRILVLRALAQAGHPAATDAIRPFLNHHDARIRGEAVGALQWILGDEVDTSLVGKALADGCRTVRERAVNALGQRPPSDLVIEGLQRVARTDPAPDVKRQATFVLNALRPQFREHEIPVA